MDAHLERRRGRGAGPALREGPPGRRRSTGSARGRSSRRSPAPFEVLEERPGSDLVGWRYAGPFDDLPAVRKAFAAGARRSRRTRRTSTASSPGTRSARRRGPASSTSPRAAAPRTSQLGKALGLPVIAPLDESGIVVDGLRVADRPRRPRRRRADRRAPKREDRFYRLEPDHPPLPALLALRHAARLPPRRRVVHLHGPGLRQAARGAHRGGGRRQPPLPDHGDRRPDPLDPRASATTASSTGS